MIRLYSQPDLGQQWIQRFHSKDCLFACVLGFTETGLIPGISAAGATPDDRRYTAIADAEFLYCGFQPNPIYRLPPLTAGASPALISRAVTTTLSIPTYLFDAGLPYSPSVPTIHLGGKAAQCLSSGKALDRSVVEHLFQQGLLWGDKLACQVTDGYIILGECVVGGTSTALAVLTALGWEAVGKISSSHPTCNHEQKWALVKAGLEQAGLGLPRSPRGDALFSIVDPYQVVAAVGDPMQIVVAGMAIAASRNCGVLLAGGTQMLAVYGLIQAITYSNSLEWQSQQVVVGTTRWVAEDPTGDAIGLANLLTVSLLGTQLTFTDSRYAALRAYEQGFVKEGVGAGGCAIATHLKGWGQTELLEAIETLYESGLQLMDALGE